MSDRRLPEAVLRVVGAAGIGHGRCLVAVSGGVDSVTLLHVLAGLSSGLDLALAVGHVNHQLRGAESDQDEDSVRMLAQELGIPFYVVAAPPSSVRSGKSSQVRPTLQEAARHVRYRALRGFASDWGADVIATAHNADDQAETLLLRILRGCGPDGLAGIPERSRDGLLLRPFLGISRDAIETYASAQGLTWREDSSNASMTYARNRLRAQWLPDLMKEFNPQLVRALGNLAAAQQRDQVWMRDQVDQEAARRVVHDQDGLWIDCTDWSSLPEALAWRLARYLLHEAGGGRDVSQRHLVRLLRCLEATPESTGRTEFPGGLRLERQHSRARLFRVEMGPAC